MHDEHVSSTFPIWNEKSNREKGTMKSLAFLKQVDHDRKVAIYAAVQDGKMRNFAYHEELGECRETFSRLLSDVQTGEIGVIMTSDASRLWIETSPRWMELLIQAVKRHEVLIGDHGHDLVYDLREEGDEECFRGLSTLGEYERERNAPRPLVDAIAQSPFAAASIEKGENWFLVTDIERNAQTTPISCLSSGARGKDADMWGMGPLKELLDTLAPYGITEADGWSPVQAERKGWLSRIQQQEDAVAERATAALLRHGGVLKGRSQARSQRRRKRGGRNQ